MNALNRRMEDNERGEKMTATLEPQEVIQDLELLEKVKNLIETDGLTQKDLAKKLNISETVLSLYLNQKYSKGDLKKLENSITQLLEYNRNLKAYKKVQLDFRKTSVAKEIFTIARTCQYNGEIGLCTGASGLGKTTAIKQYAKEHRGVIVIDPDENITVRRMLKYFATPLRMGMGCNESAIDFTDKVVSRLIDSNKLIIVDEAENLDLSCFRVLRKIHDRCQGTVGLLFIGTETVRNKLCSLKNEYAYIQTRFSYIDSLEELKKEDVKILVEQIFPDIEDIFVDLFCKVSKNNARVLFNILKRTIDILRSSNDSLSMEAIKAAGTYVGWAGA